jgi:hypothetical protein
MPEAIVPRVGRGTARGLLEEAFWVHAPVLTLRRAQDAAAPRQATSVRVAHDADALYVRFDCDDREIWATHTRHDAPLWEEEVVEVFIAPGEADPTEYVEIEVNPLGTVFDARVANPDGRRESMRVDPGFSPPGLIASVTRHAPESWRAELAIPWRELGVDPLPRVWRANFFRIDRPKGGTDEFSCWSPTLSDPPDFHKPACFGRLILADAGAPP